MMKDHAGEIPNTPNGPDVINELSTLVYFRKKSGTNVCANVYVILHVAWLFVKMKSVTGWRK